MHQAIHCMIQIRVALILGQDCEVILSAITNPYRREGLRIFWEKSKELSKEQLMYELAIHCLLYNPSESVLNAIQDRMLRENIKTIATNLSEDIDTSQE